MSKGSKSTSTSPNGKNLKKEKGNEKAHSINEGAANSDFLFRMSLSPRIGADANWFQMIPAVFFTAVVIMIVRMSSYTRPMDQFFWNGSKNQLTDFFSHYKMIAILICITLTITILLYRVFAQAFYIKRSFAYLPMLVYSALVILSYVFSDYKEFALWGWNDRFEGTLVLLGYMVMLFYIINTINSEKNVKAMIYVLAASSTILGLLGLTQASNHDFFKTIIGKKFITPSWFWDSLDNLNFTFTNQIYQTVYNINYVSFYLTLLIPIFGLLFIRSVLLGKEEPLYKKLIWGAVFALLLFNLIGSASSGGLMGMAFVVLIAVIVLNKRLLNWWKPIAVLLVITLLIGGASVSRWLPELLNAQESVSGERYSQIMESNNIKHKLDSLITDDDFIILGYDGEQIAFRTYPDDPAAISITDSEGKILALSPTEESENIFRLEDERFNWITVQPGSDDQGNHYIVISTDDFDWAFQLTKDGPKYYNGVKNLIDLRVVPAIGWEDNQSFGTGRGYIWSRTIPLIKETILIGHGADTYCIYFPHDDYVGKYNSGSFSSNINIIVDKPHNMYFGYIIGTGLISMIMLLILWFGYIGQSFVLYRKVRNLDFITFTGLGIFLGICGFLVSALVDDSNVSVTPMFYGLLGTGIAINMMLKKNTEKSKEL